MNQAGTCQALLSSAAPFPIPSSQAEAQYPAVLLVCIAMPWEQCVLCLVLLCPKTSQEILQ